MILHGLSFRLPGTEDWEVRLQATFLRPLVPAHPSLMGLQQVKSAQANIVVNRTSTESEDPEVERGKFMAQVVKAVPNLEVHSDAEEFTFTDKRKGVITTLSFPATAEIKLIQLHAFRIDDGVLTQIVVTVDEASSQDERDALLKIIESFELPATDK